MTSHSPNEITAFQYAIQPISDAFKFIKAVLTGFLKSLRAFLPAKIRSLIPDSETNESTRGLSFARTFLYSQLEHWYVIFSILLASVPFIIMTAGWDMAVGLFDNYGTLWSRWWFIWEMGFSAFLFAIICWRLPIHYFADEYLGKNINDCEGELNGGKKNFTCSDRQEIYKFNSLLIFVLLIFWLLYVQFNFIDKVIEGVAAVAAIFLVLWIPGRFAAQWFENLRKKWADTEGAHKGFRKRLPLGVALALCLVVQNIIVFLALLQLPDTKNWLNILLIFYLATSGTLFWLFADYFDRIARDKEHRTFADFRITHFPKNNFLGNISLRILDKGLWLLHKIVYLFVSKSTEEHLKEATWKKPFLYLHAFCYVFVMAALVFYVTAPYLEVVNPIFSLIYGASYLVFFLDWLNYLFFRRYYLLYRWTLVIGAALFIWMLVDAFVHKISFLPVAFNILALGVTLGWLFRKPTEPQSTVGGVLTNWLRSPAKKLVGAQLQLFVAAFIFLILTNIARPNFASHNVKMIENTHIPPLLTIENYTKGWLTDRMQNLTPKDSVYDIFIMAGQGGGSRAAYWFSKVMTELDTSGHFRQHCFAFSTVSGSSVGAEGILALWDQKARSSNDSAFSRNAFKHNFLSGGISDVFFRDNFTSYWPNSGEVNPAQFGRGDRNHRLQREEAMHIERAIRGHTKYNETPFYNSYWLFDEKYENYTTDKPFLSFYYDKQDKPDFRLPLFFPNCTQVKDGKRAFISPVIVDATICPNIYNLTDLLINEKKSISLNTAANLSEAFPLISAPHRIARANGEDSFVDGGYYENYGLATAFEVYQVLKKVVIETPAFKGRFKIHLISVINSPHANTNPLSDTTHSSLNPVFAPIFALVNATFGGRLEDIHHLVSKTLISEAQYTEIVLPSSGQAKTDVPLTRFLSNAVMETMDSRVKTDVKIQEIRKVLSKY